MAPDDTQRVTFRLVARAVDPGFLDLPWHAPLAEWACPNLREVEAGIHRHVVRFVDVGGALYALKEMDGALAEREYRLLGQLGGTNVPSVEPVGILVDRRLAGGEELSAVLITHYLEYSLPFRLILARGALPAPEPVLLEGVAELLVRLHLGGVFWGDCSLSNTLFRRDAGTLEAYLVDAETGEMHGSLSDGQRRHDLEIAYENLSYELFDLASELGWQPADDPSALADDVLRRYDRLWRELTEDDVFRADEAERLADRLHQLNELGFDAEEVELVKGADEYRLRLSSHAVEAGHHRRRLLRLTGLDAQEGQARRLLGDIRAFRTALQKAGEEPVSEVAGAARWLNEVFEPSLAAIPPELRGKRAAAELFHELLEHRWFLSERTGREIGMRETVPAYVESVLRTVPDERTALVRRPGG